jgi:hypothetical protein
VLKVRGQEAGGEERRNDWNLLAHQLRENCGSARVRLCAVIHSTTPAPGFIAGIHNGIVPAF